MMISGFPKRSSPPFVGGCSVVFLFRRFAAPLRVADDENVAEDQIPSPRPIFFSFFEEAGLS